MDRITFRDPVLDDVERRSLLAQAIRRRYGDFIDLDPTLWKMKIKRRAPQPAS